MPEAPLDRNARAGPAVYGPPSNRAPVGLPRFDRLVLPFGLGIAAATFAYWTAVEYDRYGRWMGEGAVRAALVLGAVGVLSLVLRLALRFEERDRP